MKKIIILTVAIFMFSMVGNVSAQQQDNDSVLGNKQVQLTDEQKERFTNELQEYFEELNISDSQKDEFKDISIKYAKQLKTLKESDKSRFSKYRKHKSIKKNKNKEMKNLLTKEQFKVYKKKQKEMQKKSKERMKNR